MPTQLSPLSTPASAPAPDLTGIATQVKVVGALQAVYASLMLVAGVFVLITGGYVGSVIAEEGNEATTATFVQSLMGVVGFVLITMGTLGIYGLVVLTNRNAAYLFERGRATA